MFIIQKSKFTHSLEKKENYFYKKNQLLFLFIQKINTYLFIFKNFKLSIGMVSEKWRVKVVEIGKGI